MRQYAGNARKIWNLALNRQQELHTAGEKFTNSFGMSQTLQQVTKDLAAAYKNFFEKRADFPQFKKKGRSSDSFRFPQGFEIDEANRRIRLPKLGWIHYRKSHGILGLAKNITVSCVAGKWYASIQTWAANTSINVDSRPRCWHHAIRDAL
jgi:putative transposase